MVIKFNSFGEKKGGAWLRKKGERRGQNGIKKKWDYKYPIHSLSCGRLDNIKKRGEIQIFLHQA
jgi:hypothetical protein